MSIDGPKLYYITVATRPHHVLNKIIEQVQKQNEQIFVLGLQENRSIGWEGTANFGVKLRETRDFLFHPQINPQDIVLFTDAYDVIYQGDFDEIVARFLEFSKPLVFGCETTCNPIPSYEQYYQIRSCEFPYLNSGLFIGRAWALRKCFAGYQYNDRDDDQGFWTVQFLDKNKDLFVLDYHNRIFLNTYGIDLSLIKKDGDKFRYKGTVSSFIHVNGPDKNELNFFV
jgi:hypothetical protein